MQKRGINIALIIGISITLLVTVSACHTTKTASSNEKRNTKDTIVVSEKTTVDTVHRKTFVHRNTPSQPQSKQLNYLDYYNIAFDELENMLNDNQPLDFKRAVFITEKAYFRDSLSYEKFNNRIHSLVNIADMWMRSNAMKDYNFPDSNAVKKNGAIFTLMKDTIYFIEDLPFHRPFQYDFEDFLGEKEWSNQFVTKLLLNGSGNCHSLPYLYKILADELQTEAYLSLAPNHIYIKHRSKKWGWYNTELTSGEFPTDAWVKASGYITLDAIRNGIYMDTLGQKESVALCVYDLAKGYLVQTKNSHDGFVLKCCDLVLKHDPQNINALILKAETLKKQYDVFKSNNEIGKAQQTYTQMQQLYVKGLEMGYREMPLAMYLEWLSSINEQKDKYVNSEINRTFNNR
ncbi:MAG: hypothetical protein COA32_15915 [Fluviicola sp.]|nr:MAG: hypothetical protein COA32_15915 [Fluviicola sp.]